eukprot:364776-Chlamydomonas_euryale.AAC.10
MASTSTTRRRSAGASAADRVGVGARRCAARCWAASAASTVRAAKAKRCRLPASAGASGWMMRCLARAFVGRKLR